MSPEFSSDALKENLARTKVEVLIPPEHEVLLRLSAERHGIYARAHQFLLELNHPYPNNPALVEEIRLVALGDLWFWLSTPDVEHVLNVLTDIFGAILRRLGTTALRRRHAQTLLEFASGMDESRQKEALRPVVGRCLDLLESAFEQDELLRAFASSFLRTQGRALARDDFHGARLRNLQRRCLACHLDLWARSMDLVAWFEARGANPALAARIESLSEAFYAEQRDHLERAESAEDLAAVMDFNTLADRHRHLLRGVATPFEQARYILHLLKKPVMRHLSEQLLWDLSRAFRELQAGGEPEVLGAFIDGVFDDFRDLAGSDDGAVLDCILNLGKAVYETGRRPMVDHFLDRVVAFGFIRPGLGGITSDWQVEVDHNHVKNIRVWMRLIEMNPAWSTRLVAALVVHLKFGGVFIADNDLFQKDVSQLLAAEIGGCYKLILQLGRLFPVYFNEVGAEGELRDVTSHVDALSQRQDRLVHFVRKQVHAESNSTHIELVRGVLRYWHDGDTRALLPRLPADVAETLVASGPWVDGMRAALRGLTAALGLDVVALADQPVERIKALLAENPEISDLDRERTALFLRLHELLSQKYSLDADATLPQMKRVSRISNLVVQADVERLQEALGDEDPRTAVHVIFDLMDRLRRVILDRQPTEAREDIFYKRHIAAGIPSMYGSYFEPRFNALGLTYRLEVLATQLLTSSFQRTHIGYISRNTLRYIHDLLAQFQRGLELVGIENEGFNSHLKMLEFSLKTPSFSLTQFVNLFQFMAENVREIIQDYFLRYYDDMLKEVLRQYILADARKAPVNGEMERRIAALSEDFYRDVLSNAPLVTALDGVIAAVLDKLNTVFEHLPPSAVPRVMSFELDQVVSPLMDEVPELDNQVFLGAKGYFLRKLWSFGFPVPPAYILTTELFRIRDAFDACPPLWDEVSSLILEQLARLEQVTGRRYGDVTKVPLLLSVRSGSAISMPGAMNTFLNIGLNDEVVEALSHQPNFGWTSWDCYRRSLQTWGMAHGMDRDGFDLLISDFKRTFGVHEKLQFRPAQMRELAFEYKKLLHAHGLDFEQDLKLQLLGAIKSVLNSWDTDRARVYRERLRIADEWGTAVIVQAMVLGNINYDSGTGVVFTHDPYHDEAGIHLYGDFVIVSQGEDVVAGLVHPWPISRRQKERMELPPDAISLETHFPEVYEELRRRAVELVEQRGFMHQEIEFTFETQRGSDLWILQTRNQTPPATEGQPVFAVDDLGSLVIGKGMGIGGGAMNGRVAFTAEDLRWLAAEYPGENRVLVRPDTVPDDIGMIFESEGLLTARGGVTSHAAVTATRLGKTCVVNCRALEVHEAERFCRIRETRFNVGDQIAIDGYLGNILKGCYPVTLSDARRLG